MKRTTYQNVKIGDKLQFTASQYGQYINCVIVDIEISKSGRIKLFYGGQYKSADGSIEVIKRLSMSNGPLVPHTSITIY